MNKIDIFSLSQVASNPHCLRLAMSYKNYCSIRRDLRTANDICQYIIDLHQRILQDPLMLEKLAATLFLVRGALMHAVVLYGRWFKATTRKPSLSPNIFFTEGSDEHQAHGKLIDLRDKYVAHYELDILGSDRIWACFALNGHFAGTESDWVEQQFIQLEDVNMESFRQCIHTVHNKIDAEILPKIQWKLDTQLRKIYA
jgi:hypothetical protein